MSDPFLYLQHPARGLAQRLARVLHPFPKRRGSGLHCSYGNDANCLMLICITAPFLSWLPVASLCHLSFVQCDFWSLPFLSVHFLYPKGISFRRDSSSTELFRSSSISKKKKKKKHHLIAFHSVINLLFKRHLVKLKIISLNHVFTSTIYKTLDYRSPERTWGRIHLMSFMPFACWEPGILEEGKNRSSEGLLLLKLPLLLYFSFQSCWECSFLRERDRHWPWFSGSADRKVALLSWWIWLTGDPGNCLILTFLSPT